MSDLRDELMLAVISEKWDIAMKLIEQIKEHQTLLIYRVNTKAFELAPDEPMEFEKTTDFLPFHGWEAA